MPRDFVSRIEAAESAAAVLNARYAGKSAQEILRAAILNDLPGRIALASSFGSESVVLLHMIAQVDRDVPVLFGQTQMLFAETLAYQREIAELLGLRDIREVRPVPAVLAAQDPDNGLHQRNADACCALRKTAPMQSALAPFSAWITGRKRHQSATRADLKLVEVDQAGRLKINPLADWTAQELNAYRIAQGLPAHPLVEKGFVSIGCAPCTTPVKPGEHPRAGRWRGQAKEECGIHVIDGKVEKSHRGPMD
ncbi:MAG: phosphoadenylyl-sulfate reductase [Neomegalonema sp.]|nr:phosphoadenylyl-sulfate reductase [Neomegalonema sp.]